MSTKPSDSDGLPGGAASNMWLAFAGVLLVLNGVFAVLYGITAITDSGVVTVGGGGDVTIWDFTTWGWISVVLGATMALTGVGLITGNDSARWIAVVLAGAHAVAQFGSLTAFPLWSIFVITLDIVILYQLVVRWHGHAHH